MEKDNKKITRAEKFGIWLAYTKFGEVVFSDKKNIIIFFSSFMLFTHLLYWSTAWWSPWPYISFMLLGVWFGQGILSPFTTIIKQSMEKDWDPLFFKISIPFMLLNWAAFFACLYTFGIINDSSGTQVQGVWKHFYFSVVTLTTLGYGNLVPGDFISEILATIETLIGFMGFAVLAGIIASIVYKRAEFK